jgi:hypothetical protein
MTIKMIFLLLAAQVAFAQPVVSNISTVRVSHSTVTLKFDTSSVGAHVRVRYGLTTAYEGAGSFPDSGIQFMTTQWDLNPSRWVETRIGGLKAGTTYQFCPQVSTDKTVWSTCVNHTVTTDPLPAGPHPAYPISPTPVDTGRPNTSGYTVRAVASNCSDLQTHINAAAANLLVNGSIITIPAGTICTGNYTLKAPPGVKTFSTANVNTLTNRITVTAHGFSDNDVVKISAGQPPGSVGHDMFRQHRGFAWGNLYYARVIDANTIQLADTSGGPAKPFTTTTFTASGATISVPNGRHVPINGNTVQVVTTGTLPSPLAVNTTYYVVSASASGRTFQLSATSGGAAITTSDAGSGVHSIADQGGGGSFLKWPPTANYIVIRTATPDSQFVPEGVRVTPEFQPKMATIRTSNRAVPALSANDLASNYRFEGIEFTHTDTATAEIATTINPQHFLYLIHLQRTTGNIILDRCYIHGLGFPNRITRAIPEFNGANSAIINSYWEKLDYWTPVRAGISLARVNNTQFTISAGTFHLGYGSRSLAAPVTVNLSGAASGTVTGRVYFTMAGVLTLDLPTGVSASCVGGTCNVVNSATPIYAKNGDGGTTVMPIGNLSFTNAALTSVAGESLDPDGGHTRSWEGASSFLAGDIAGRTALINNTISSAGLPVHYDNANGNSTSPTPADYTIYRNHFIVPRTQIWSLPESDKLRYGQRQQLEWKNGQRIRIRGNIFEGVFSDVTPIATAVAISGTPGPHASVTDVEIGYNIFRHGAGSWAVLGGRAVNYGSTGSDTNPAVSPLQRAWIHNNLSYGIDQYKYRAYAPGYNAMGNAIDHRYLFEDLRVEHNTIHDSRGVWSRVMLFGGQPNEGFRVADNIIWLNGGAVFMADECGNNVPPCAGDGKAMLDSMAHAYAWRNNTIIAGWTNETGTTARTSKTYITGVLPSDMADAYLQSEMPGAIDWADPTRGDFRIGSHASHKSGGAKRAGDGLDRGVDMDALEREVGVVRLADPLNITSTSAKIPFVAPDRGTACRIAYGTGDPATWTGRSAADTTDTFARLISIPGPGGDPLTANTEYVYRVWCAGTAQSKTTRFRTAAE